MLICVRSYGTSKLPDHSYLQYREYVRTPPNEARFFFSCAIAIDGKSLVRGGGSCFAFHPIGSINCQPWSRSLDLALPTHATVSPACTATATTVRMEVGLVGYAQEPPTKRWRSWQAVGIDEYVAFKSKVTSPPSYLVRHFSSPTSS